MSMYTREAAREDARLICDRIEEVGSGYKDDPLLGNFIKSSVLISQSLRAMILGYRSEMKRLWDTDIREARDRAESLTGEL